MKMWIVMALLAIATCVTPGQPVAAETAKRSEYHEQIVALPRLKRQALVLLVAQRVSQNSKDLMFDTPKHGLDSIKVMSVEHMQMSWVARDAGWPEMQKLYEDSADMFVRTIRGELKGEAGKTEVAALERRRLSIASAAARRVDAAGISNKDRDVEPLARKIATEIAAKARIYTWGKKAK